MPKTERRQGETAGEQRIREEFGARVEALRLKAQLSHAQLATEAKIERSQLTRIINGRRRWNSDQLARLAAALKVQPTALLGGDRPTPASSREPSTPKGPPGLEEFIERHKRRLSPDDVDELRSGVRLDDAFWWEVVHRLQQKRAPPDEVVPRRTPAVR